MNVLSVRLIPSPREALLTWTATYAMARGVTDLMPKRLATLPRVGAFRFLVRLRGRED